MTTELVVERHDDVVWLRINRPAVYNALNAEVLRGLEDTIAAVQEDPSARAVVISGEGGKAFSAGADLDQFDQMTADQALETLRLGQRVFRSVELSSTPVIAAVDGVALGGGFELVLACTFPVLSTRVSLGLPEGRLGLMPGYGGTQRLTRVVGSPVATHLMLTGERLGATRAYELGLTPVEPVVPERLVEVAFETARRLVASGPLATAAILQAVEHTRPGGWQQGLDAEAMLAALSIAREESTEGIAAFREKRPARFVSDDQAKRIDQVGATAPDPDPAHG